MLYYSTRDKEKKNGVTASDAILKGLAKDGGLFVPETLPKLESLSASLPYPEFAAAVLKPFFKGDLLENELLEICRSAFNFPLVLNPVNNYSVLELFHGPTAAFKDFGARFLAASMEKLLSLKNKKLTILVATSGDTGGAVASAFYQREHLSVKVLFPKGRVALRQKKQLTVWGDNVSSYEVEGSFDDCQKMVKQAFMDPNYTNLSSANSINLGRLLPQMVYYVYTSTVYFEKTGLKPNFIIPSGNVGNCTGAYWAIEMGAPINSITLAVNENKTIPDYLATKVYTPRSSVQTLANAMDVGAPSNMERLFNLYPTYEEFSAKVSAYSVSDEEIKETIKQTYKEDNYICCPHTATGIKTYHSLNNPKDTIVVSTAHPAKFETIVEPLIEQMVEIPPSLKTLLDKESIYKEIGTDYHSLF